MCEKKKDNIWIYGVILFTSAFIVLLFAAYSQIKLNKSLDDYKSQAFSSETEKNRYMQNFLSAQEMNEKLNEEISKLESKVAILEESLAGIKSENEVLNNEVNILELTFSKFIVAVNMYLDGKAVDAADIIKNLDLSGLFAEKPDSCKPLVDKINSDAGKSLLDEGLTIYRKRRYKEAAEVLAKSYEYAPSGPFTDKCLYYLAQAKHRSGDTKTAVAYMKLLVDKFKDSVYKDNAKFFIGRYDN